MSGRFFPHKIKKGIGKTKLGIGRLSLGGNNRISNHGIIGAVNQGHGIQQKQFFLHFTKIVRKELGLRDVARRKSQVKDFRRTCQDRRIFNCIKLILSIMSIYWNCAESKGNPCTYNTFVICLIYWLTVCYNVKFIWHYFSWLRCLIINQVDTFYYHILFKNSIISKEKPLYFLFIIEKPENIKAIR